MWCSGAKTTARRLSPPKSLNGTATVRMCSFENKGMKKEGRFCRLLVALLRRYGLPFISALYLCPDGHSLQR